MNNIKLVDVLWTIVLMFMSIITILLIVNFSSSKVNNGYYLNQYRGEQTAIWINWDNRIDEKAFQHHDINVVLKVFSQLNAELRQNDE